MLDKTLGYILCCQSPALFLAALALLVAYLAGRKHKVRAFFRLLLCILCAAGGVALYFLGIYKEYFTIRDFFLIRTAGWIGLAIAAFFVLLALVRALKPEKPKPHQPGLRPARNAGSQCSGGRRRRVRCKDGNSGVAAIIPDATASDL